MTTKCTWSLPTGVRSAVDFEARRRGTTPSRLVSEFFADQFPDYVANALRRTIRMNLDEPRAPTAKLSVVPDEPEGARVS